MDILVTMLDYVDQTSQQVSAGSMVVSLIIGIIGLAAQWKLFTKAGEAGWKCIIPIYNAYIIFKIVYGNGWKFLFLCVPVLNIIFSIGYLIRLAQVYGKSTAFGIGLIFLNPIFMIILAFGDSSYQGAHHGFV